jgi:hypothetical protein
MLVLYTVTVYKSLRSSSYKSIPKKVMGLEIILGTSLVALVVVIALYVWAFTELRKKWSRLSQAWRLLYLIIAFMGPVPMLVFLYLDVGVVDNVDATERGGGTTS